jgi:hypothetical protein
MKPAYWEAIICLGLYGDLFYNTLMSTLQTGRCMLQLALMRIISGLDSDVFL